MNKNLAKILRFFRCVKKRGEERSAFRSVGINANATESANSTLKWSGSKMI